MRYKYMGEDGAIKCGDILDINPAHFYFYKSHRERINVDYNNKTSLPRGNPDFNTWLFKDDLILDFDCLEFFNAL